METTTIRSTVVRSSPPLALPDLIARLELLSGDTTRGHDLRREIKASLKELAETSVAMEQVAGKFISGAGGLEPKTRMTALRDAMPRLVQTIAEKLEKYELDEKGRERAIAVLIANNLLSNLSHGRQEAPILTEVAHEGVPDVVAVDISNPAFPASAAYPETMTSPPPFVMIPAKKIGFH